MPMIYNHFYSCFVHKTSQYKTLQDHEMGAILKNMWTNHYNQPPNSTLGGFHMTLTTHDFVEWVNPIRISPKWSCSGRQWLFKKFMLKMVLGMTENFPFHIFKPLGLFFLMVILNIVHKVNHLTR